MHPEISSTIMQAFSMAGWELVSNCSVSTVPPNTDTIFMMIDMLVQNLQYNIVVAPPADDAAVKKYTAAELTHAIVLDTSHRANANLASIVGKRLTYCAQLSGGGMPPPPGVICDTIILHGVTAGAMIHWKETEESVGLTAGMMARLRAQLPMAVNDFHLVGHIFSAGADDAALAATSVPSISWEQIPQPPLALGFTTAFQGPDNIEADMVLTATVEWKQLVKRAEVLRAAIGKLPSDGPITKVTVLPAAGDKEAQGLTASWYQVLCGMTPVGQLTAMLAAGPPTDVAPEHHNNWICQIAIQIQQTVLSVDLNEMLEGASLMDAPVKGGTWVRSELHFLAFVFVFIPPADGRSMCFGCSSAPQPLRPLSMVFTTKPTVLCCKTDDFLLTFCRFSVDSLLKMICLGHDTLGEMPPVVFVQPSDYGAVSHSIN